MNFWEEQRVLITGGHGFLGRHLTHALRERNVGVLVTPTRDEADWRDVTHIRSQLEAAEPTMIIHLAAVEGGIGVNSMRPAEFFYDNAVMALHLLHEAYVAGVAKFVGIGTVAAYPKFAPAPFQEADLWNGYPDRAHAPYGLAKKMMLVQSQAYRQQYGFNAIHLLPANLYGPGDDFDLATARVIPALIRRCIEAAARGEDVIYAWGDGTPTREFLYVSDAVEAIVRAAEQYDDGEPVNIGTGREISIRDLAHRIGELTGFTGRWAWDTSRPGGQPRRVLNVDRAWQAFGFRARVSLDDGLRRTIDWYRAQIG